MNAASKKELNSIKSTLENPVGKTLLDNAGVVVEPAVPQAEIERELQWPTDYSTGFHLMNDAVLHGLYHVQHSTRPDIPAEVTEVTNSLISYTEKIENIQDDNQISIFKVEEADRVKSIDLPASIVASGRNTLIEEFGAKGIFVSPEAHSYFSKWIYETNKRLPTQFYSSKPGWNREDGSLKFYAPGLIISNEGVSETFVSKDSYKTTSGSSLDDWKKQVGKLLRNNPVLMLSALTAMSGPISGLLNQDMAVGIHLTGDSQLGKSSAMTCGASVWGNPDLGQFALNWNATQTGLEALCESRNNLCIILDEISLAEDKSDLIPNMIYLWANKSGRTRSNQKTTLNKAKSWVMSMISTGEKPVSSYTKNTAGHENRLLDFPSTNRKYGAFDDLHGYINGETLSKAIKELTLKHYGTAGPELVQYLTKQVSGDDAFIEKLKSRLFILADEFKSTMASKLSIDFGAIVSSRISNLATLVLTGELACEAGIFDKDSDYKESIYSMFEVWLEGRGNSADTSEYKRLVERLFKLLNDSKRFNEVLIDGPIYKPGESYKAQYPAGIREIKRITEDERIESFYINCDVFKLEVLNGGSLSNSTIKNLVRDGFLDEDKTGSIQKKFGLWDLGNRRYYFIKYPAQEPSKSATEAAELGELKKNVAVMRQQLFSLVETIAVNKEYEKVNFSSTSEEKIKFEEEVQLEKVAANERAVKQVKCMLEKMADNDSSKNFSEQDLLRREISILDACCKELKHR